MRVAVLGAGGRMGIAVCSAVTRAADLELVAAIDPAHRGETTCGLVVSSDLEDVRTAGADVVVDFTVASSAMANLRLAASAGLHAVVGTTGLGANDLDEAGSLYPPSGEGACIVAANFSIGAVLMMRFAELAAPWFATAEIVEIHHDAKVDAPSGTALETARRMVAASPTWGADPTTVEPAAGARGACGESGVAIHSLRLRGVVANQEVVLGDEGQTLTIRHDTIDRAAFMPGVLAALRATPRLPGLTIGLDAVLGV